MLLLENNILSGDNNQAVVDNVGNIVNVFSAEVLKFTDDISSLKQRFKYLINMINNWNWISELPKDLQWKIILKRNTKSSIYDKLKKEVINNEIDSYLLIDDNYEKNINKLLEHISKFDDIWIKTSWAYIGYRGSVTHNYSIIN